MLGFLGGDNGKEDGSYDLGFEGLGFRVSGLGFRIQFQTSTSVMLDGSRAALQVFGLGFCHTMRVQNLYSSIK